MKPISELAFPTDRHYSSDHEWILKDGDEYIIGISDYAQDQLGDLVFVELPEVGDSFEKGDEFGTVESVKAVSELYMPFSCEVVAINDALEEEPELVSNDPFGKGWMLKVVPTDASELESLLDHAAYKAEIS